MAPVIDLTGIPSSPSGDSAPPPRKRAKLDRSSGSGSLPTPAASDEDVFRSVTVDSGKAKAPETALSLDGKLVRDTGSTPPAASQGVAKSPSPEAATLPPKQRVSIYVQAFEEMLNTVMSNEAFLFDEAEAGLLEAWHGMSYEARYLFVRLFIRKNGWFRIDKLGYNDEIGNIKRASDAMCLPTVRHLQKAREDPPKSPATDSAPLERAPVAHPLEAREAGPSRPGPSPPRPAAEPLSLTEADDASSIFSGDTDLELELDAALSEFSGALDDASKEFERPLLDPSTVPNFESPERDLSAFAVSSATLTSVDEILDVVSLDEVKAIAKEMKVHKPGTTKEAIVGALKRATRSQATLFASPGVASTRGKGKQLSLNFDSKGVKQGQTTILTKKVLRLTGPCVKLQPAATDLFSRLHLIFYRSFDVSDKSMTASMLARFKIRAYPSYTVKRTFAIFPSRTALLEYEAALAVEKEMERCLGESPEGWKPKGSGDKRGAMTKDEREEEAERERQRKMALLEEGRGIFEGAWKTWGRLVAESDAEEEKKEAAGTVEDSEQYRLTYYRKRFDSGWPLTRVAYKGAHILSRFHEYGREIEVLKALLAQKHYRRGKRGAWYDRLALVLMNHVGNDDEDAKKRARKRALKVCVKGLQDPWTHLIYHNSLQRRIARLESLLPIPKSEQHDFTHVALQTATKRTLYGEKLFEGETGKKSVWRAMDGAECSVEDLCLEWYVKKDGWKGFHSENGVVTTIFCLIFWDVIFAPVDGVFEHAYQSAPLDLSTDAFAIVRSSLVRERLASIEAGNAVAHLLEADQRERERETWCVGVRWAYTREDLVEIVEALGGRAVSAICRVYAEEWGHRVGGMPDLCLWNSEKKRCRFVEVKGPGDRLSETQKVWIDVLLGAGVEVELCAVEQADEATLLQPQKKGKRKKRSGSSERED